MSFMSLWRPVKTSTVTASLSLMLGLSLSASPAKATLKIMCMGDSLTYGYSYANDNSVADGYRKPLAQLLTNAGISFQFVGSQQDNRDPSFTQNMHDGFPGWAIPDLVDGKNGMYPMSDIINMQPDIVLLMAGTNDFLVNNEPVAVAQNDLSILIQTIHKLDPHAHIIVSTIFPFVNINVSPRTFLNPIDSYAVSLNSWITATAASVVPAGTVSVVDNYSNFNLANSTDGVHSIEPGYVTAAQVWFNGLNAYLNPPPPPPPSTCVANSASQLYLAESDQYFLSMISHPAVSSIASTCYANLTNSINILTAQGWPCASTITTGNYATACNTLLQGH